MKKTNKKRKQSAREIALHLLGRIETQGGYANRLLTSKNVSKLSLQDRLFLRELVLGVLRWKIRLDHIIDNYYDKKPDSLQIEVRNIIRLGLFQIIFMNSVPEWAAVNESVDIATANHGKSAAGLVNALLRRFCREGEPKIKSSNVAVKLSVKMSHPLWITKKWIDRFGIKTVKSIMAAGNEKHPVSIRTNTTKTSSESLTKELSSEGFETTASAIPGFYTVLKSNGLFDTPAFKNGLFTVQDSASSVACLLLSPEQGEKVLDICAAPGGKATHLAEMMGDNGYIEALDINAKRLGLVRDAAKRLGLKSIHCIEGDAVTYKNKNDILYDRVLLDAPCTGTAVFSKRPDMKWQKEHHDVTRMSSLQKTMLENASTLVRPGGILVYSTCSLEHEENEDIINRFIDKYDFSLEKDDRFIDFEVEGGYLIFPHLMNGTGAFAAKMKRNEG